MTDEIVTPVENEKIVVKQPQVITYQGETYLGQYNKSRNQIVGYRASNTTGGYKAYYAVSAEGKLINKNLSSGADVEYVDLDDVETVAWKSVVLQASLVTNEYIWKQLRAKYLKQVFQ